MNVCCLGAVCDVRCCAWNIVKGDQHKCSVIVRCKTTKSLSIKCGTDFETQGGIRGCENHQDTHFTSAASFEYVGHISGIDILLYICESVRKKKGFGFPLYGTFFIL